MLNFYVKGFDLVCLEKGVLEKTWLHQVTFDGKKLISNFLVNF